MRFEFSQHERELLALISAIEYTPTMKGFARSWQSIRELPTLDADHANVDGYVLVGLGEMER